MKLCRFELTEIPGTVRSGVYHDGKIYETDGNQAIGIHELGSLVFAPPLGLSPTIRCFEDGFDSAGHGILGFRYLNPGIVHSPGTDIEMSSDSTGLGLQVHVVGAVGDRGQHVDVVEAESFVLGYSIMLVLTDPHLLEIEKQSGFSAAAAFDPGIVIGPFLTTPEELNEHRIGSDATGFAWKVEVRINSDLVWSGVYDTGLTFAEMLSQASRTAAVLPGDLIAWPAVRIPPLDETALGRLLLPSDKIIVKIEGLGALTTAIS